ncbi:excinuclease ABC subunit UvrA [Candidatus Gottesmanbacteria bacterium]|nr:excinuclease ABC subunit UvrA [Candidatus Gottesmanbacteria bacterium]
MSQNTSTIHIRGARENNLKNVHLDIPKNSLVVFTGVSGSGKSSLAFDTIYAEGQRRYVESLSSYARQFLGVMDKPDVDAIDGLSPAISIDQKSTSHNPRSTVGTITEIYDYLRLLFARVGHPHCPNCGREIIRQSPQLIVDTIMQSLSQKVKVSSKKPIRVMILSPVIRDRKGEFTQLFDTLRSKGYTAVRVDGTIYSLSEDLILIKTNKHSIDVVMDRFTLEKRGLKEDELKSTRMRMTEAIEQSITLSEGLAIVSEVTDASFTFPDKPKKLHDTLYSVNFSCPVCNISIPEIEPRIFSFNSPHGACPSCGGIGSLLRINPDLIINPNLTINEGAILPFAKIIFSDTWYGRIILHVAKSFGIRLDRPLRELSKEQNQKLLYGTGETEYAVTGENRFGREVTIYETYPGIIPELERRFSKTESEFVRHEISKYMQSQICPSCEGKRLKKEALSVSIDSKSIVDVTRLSIRLAKQWIENVQTRFSQREKAIANLVLREIIGRLQFLLSVGLDYLTLDRGATSLSGGEAQRIRLASQIGSGLSGVLYVLDEPSIGLHAKDNKKLIDTLRHLRDLGNSVIVVEHDREMMENADIIADFGPGAGEHGGKIIAFGTYKDILHDKSSLTGKYLSGKKKIQLQRPLTHVNEEDLDRITLIGAGENNLKEITASFPLRKFVCVSGVSGSGKSTLVIDTLYQALATHFNPYHREKIGKFQKIEGLEKLKRVILIDQSPIGRTPRSNPATYTGAFTFVRELLAQTNEARIRGFNPGRFSFNVKGGRCEACEGEGVTKIEMQFLPDVYVTCEVCNGTRFNSETLEVRFKGKNVAEILEMTVEEAREFFRNIPGLSSKLDTLFEVGLSYIHLGQPAPQLSGGEAQRVKLATELSKKSTRDTLYILDEPTTGLHFADLEKLLDVLHALVAMGNTVIVIEHNLDVLKNADWIIDLGPDGGENGGKIIATGTPYDLTINHSSYTGIELKKVLAEK